jgi:hypothetical protein
MTQTLLLFIDLVRCEGKLAEQTEQTARRVGGFISHIAQLLQERDERAFWSVKAGGGAIKIRAL